MPIFRYVGTTESAISDTKFKFSKFGQRVELPADLAERVIADLPLLPESEWSKLEISEPELKGNIHAKDFDPKLRAAWAALHDFRNPPAAVEPVPAADHIESEAK